MLTQPALVALPVSQPYGDFGKTVDWKISASEPRDVTAFVNWLVNESGWTVTERGRSEERVPLRARHICLLFRRLRHYSTDVTRDYVQALETYRIPHLLVGGSSFHSREEVEAIRNALTAVEWPDEELAVFAALRGPLFAFTDAQLLSYRSICSTLHLFKSRRKTCRSRWLKWSQRWRFFVNFIISEIAGRSPKPFKAFVTHASHAGFANWSTGEQALANLMRLTDMARRAERTS